MTATVICTAKPGSKKWLSMRPGGIGASEVATMLGGSQWHTPVELWMQKTGRAEGFSGNYASRRGQHLEAFVLAAYADAHPDTIVEAYPDVPSMLAHPDVPQARCSLDALGHNRDESLVIEIKTAGHRQRGKWIDGAMPDDYQLQVLHQLAVTGLDTAHIAVDVAGEYEERVLFRDADKCDRIIEAVARWWHDHVELDVMPKPDPKRDRDLLADLWTPNPDLPPARVGHDLANELRDAKAAAAAAKTDLEVAAARVQIAMQSATEAVTPDGDTVAKWTASKGRASIDTKALAADLPDVAANYMRTGKPGRRFSITAG
jgi:putative phage-type endonuclease